MICGIQFILEACVSIAEVEVTALNRQQSQVFGKEVTKSLKSGGKSTDIVII